MGQKSNFLVLKGFLMAVILIFLIKCPLAAQQDSLSVQPIYSIQDSTIKTKTARKSGFSKNHSPKKALLLSLALPGAGQIYNRKYWKLPIVYGGIGALGYLAVSNGSKYSCYRKSYLAMVDDDPLTVNTCDPNRSQADMKLYRDNYQKFFEYSVVGLFAFYVLTAADAFVDAHLTNFDISDDLSMRLKPDLRFNSFGNLGFSTNSMSAGLSMELQLKPANKTVIKPFF